MESMGENQNRTVQSGETNKFKTEIPLDRDGSKHIRPTRKTPDVKRKMHTPVVITLVK